MFDLSYLKLFDTHHLHPMMTHFPIAIIAIGFLTDLASVFIKREKCLPKMGYYIEIAGMIAAIAAWGISSPPPWKGRPGISGTITSFSQPSP